MGDGDVLMDVSWDGEISRTEIWGGANMIPWRLEPHGELLRGHVGTFGNAIERSGQEGWASCGVGANLVVKSDYPRPCAG